MKNRTGVTLVELMVAIALAGLAMTIGYTAYSQVSTLNERAIIIERRLQRESALRAAIIEWLSSAKPDSLTDTWQIAPSPTGESGQDRLTFDVDRAIPVVNQPATISLFIDSDPNTPEAGLLASFDTESGTQLIELCREVTQLTVESYLASTERGAWVQSRGAEMQGAEEKAVRIKLDGQRLSALMRVPIVATKVI